MLLMNVTEKSNADIQYDFINNGPVVAQSRKQLSERKMTDFLFPIPIHCRESEGQYLLKRSGAEAETTDAAIVYIL